MKLAILYAGQGSQHPGMGKDLYEAYPAFRAAFDAAALDFDLHSVCFEDPDGVLNQTEYTQPCMVAFAAGVTAVLQENGVKADDLAGLSLGEYSALQAAGVFTAKQAVELAAYRGKAMADAAKGIDCGMTAVMNLDRDALAKCCEEASALGVVPSPGGGWSAGAREPLWKGPPSWKNPPVPAAASPSRSAARSTPG